jgi:predicted nucleic acid-binding Zn ribbon protein
VIDKRGNGTRRKGGDRVDDTEQRLNDLAARQERQQKRFYARQPRAIGNVLGSVVLKKRYACVETSEQLGRVWIELVSPATAARSRPLGVKRGKFEIVVAHSALAQELSFEKVRLLAGLRKALPDTKIDDLKFQVGSIES